jgi:UDPglucose 6-dehydrogenase
MNIAVIGLWHLGCVTAACLANAGYDVTAYDPDKEKICQLQRGEAPIFEPGLDTLLQQGIQNRKLYYSHNPLDLTQAEILWITFDTPVDDHDIADAALVMLEIETIFPYAKDSALILISSQVPVGTTRELQRRCGEKWPEKNLTFVYSPENLRLGKAIEVFTQPERIVVGLQTGTDKNRIQRLFNPFTQNIIWMSLESAEMTKHALNAFLATSIVFINELATICEKVGANASDVELGLKSEERIGIKAYLKPGPAFGGGTLARDVNFLTQLGQKTRVKTPLFSALIDSNQLHKQWSCRRMQDVFINLQNKKIAMLGLTYKAGTDTLRRSTAVEMCQWLTQHGAKVAAYDPAVKQLPHHLAHCIKLKSSIEQALQNADAIVIATEWPQFTSLTVDQLLGQVNQPIVFDVSGFLMKKLGNDERIQYYSVGR